MKILIKLFTLTLLFVSSLAFAEVAVIVHPSNGSAVDPAMIKKIYLGKIKSFADGTSIKPLSLNDDSATTEDFRKKALKKSNSQYKAFWSKLAFTGKGKPPTTLGSDAEVISKVSSDKEAIGFVDAASVDDSIKVVARF